MITTTVYIYKKQITEPYMTDILKARFLNKNEYALTYDLFLEAFDDGDKEFLDIFYGELKPDGSCTGAIKNNMIAAVFDGDKLVASAQCMLVRVRTMDSNPRYLDIPYIMAVVTTKTYRHRGCMDSVLKLIIDRLMQDGYPWCFLVPVDTAIYRHLGFTADWKISLEELKSIYSDDEGLETASAKLLNGECIDKVYVCGPAEGSSIR